MMLQVFVPFAVASSYARQHTNISCATSVAAFSIVPKPCVRLRYQATLRQPFKTEVLLPRAPARQGLNSAPYFVVNSKHCRLKLWHCRLQD